MRILASGIIIESIEAGNVVTMMGQGRNIKGKKHKWKIDNSGDTRIHS